MLKSIKIPISKTNETVVIFLDELEDLAVSDLLDILRGELAPLNVWKDCAVEYHRQNQNERFSMILEEIVESLNDEDVKKIYRNSDFEEMMCEIYNVLAAKKFEDSYSQHGSYANEMDQIKSYLENVKKYVPVSEYSWLIEGIILYYIVVAPSIISTLIFFLKDSLKSNTIMLKERLKSLAASLQGKFVNISSCEF